MICIVLRQTGEMHIGAGMSGRQPLIQSILWKRKCGLPHLSIELTKSVDDLLPAFSVRRIRWRLRERYRAIWALSYRTLTRSVIFAGVMTGENRNYIVHTERLLLRPFLQTDAEALHAILTDPEVVKTTSPGFSPIHNFW